MRRVNDEWLRERLTEDGFNPDRPDVVALLLEVDRLEHELHDLGFVDTYLLA